MVTLNKIRFLVLIFLLSIPNFCLAKDYQGADLAKALDGIWKKEDGKAEYIKFLPNKVVTDDENGLNFYRAIYGKNKFGVFNSGIKVIFEIKIINEGKFALLESNKNETIFIRSQDADHKLKLEDFILGKEVASKTIIEEISKELATRIIKDQEVRKDKSKSNLMSTVDTENTKYLSEIIKKFGWINVDRFGIKTSTNAFLIVQHSGNLPLMVKVLEEIKKDFEQKKGDPQDFALLYDRTKLNIGEKQKYGSQVSMNEKGETLVLALEDKNNVEKNRKEIGLFPLSQYLQFFSQQSKSKKVVYEEDLLE